MLTNKWIMWYAIVLHWIWGVILLISRTPLNITAINPMIHLHLVSPEGAGAFYLAVSFLAFIGLFAAPRAVSLLLLLPQQLALIVSAYGAIVSMALGTFADGTIRDRAFLIADQSPVVIICLMHIGAVYTNYLLHRKDVKGS